jgi:hypothetical protein
MVNTLILQRFLLHNNLEVRLTKRLEWAIFLS